MSMVLRNGTFWIVIALGVLALAEPALAQNLQPVNNVADRFRNFLNGEIAVTVAAIALIGSGFAWWFNVIPTQQLLGVLGGIALVFGAVTIVQIFVAVARV